MKKSIGSFSMEAAFVCLVLVCMGLASYFYMHDAGNDISQLILAKFMPSST